MHTNSCNLNTDHFFCGDGGIMNNKHSYNILHDDIAQYKLPIFCSETYFGSLSVEHV